MPKSTAQPPLVALALTLTLTLTSCVLRLSMTRLVTPDLVHAGLGSLGLIHQIS